MVSGRIEWLLAVHLRLRNPGQLVDRLPVLSLHRRLGLLLPGALLRTQGRSLPPWVVVSLGRRLGLASCRSRRLPLCLPPFLAGLGALLPLCLELRVLLEQVPAVALGCPSSALGVARWLGAVLGMPKLALPAVLAPRAGAEALEHGLTHSVEEVRLLLRIALLLLLLLLDWLGALRP